MESPSTTAENGSPALLWGRTAAEDFCRQLASQDDVVAQKLLCAEIERLVSSRAPQPHQLGALLTLDRYAMPVGRRLAARYAEGDASLRVLDRRALTAALRLCRASVEAYEQVRSHIEQSNDDFWRGNARPVLMHLFRHRQLEFLLRLFRYKKRNSEQWRRLHEAYRFALACGAARTRTDPGGTEDSAAGGRTLEREFIQILLLDALNTGQFSPRELLRANNLLARWSEGLTLRPAATAADAKATLPGFIVDLDGTEGLKRPSRDAAGTLFHLDTSPLMRAIDNEIAAAPDRSDRPPAARAAPAPHDPLHARLRQALAPMPVHIRRRGDRIAVDQTVRVVIGISPIVHMLRLEAQRKAAQRLDTDAAHDGITISPADSLARITNFATGADGMSVLATATTFGAVPQSWQVKDRSDTGCRMRGQTGDLNGVIPGSLVALAASDHAPWTVAVVRRLRRLMVDHVEISVEYIGRKPRFVKIATGAAPAGGAPAGKAAKCFGALYLPASDEHPRMPIKTLLVPACVFAPGAAVTLLSSSATYALQLNKPLQQHADFVWTSFTVIDKAAALAPAAAVG